MISSPRPGASGPANCIFWREANVLGNDSLFSYVGPAPDFIPYFLGLVAWAGMALAGILASAVSDELRDSIFRSGMTSPKVAFCKGRQVRAAQVSQDSIASLFRVPSWLD